MPKIRPFVFGILLVASLVSLAPAAAQQIKYQGVRGSLVDAADAPLSGHRVVFVPEGGGQSFVSQPTRMDGAFVVSLPDGSDVVAVAVISPKGVRVELPDQPVLHVVEGARQDVKMPAAADQPLPATAEQFNDVTGKITDKDGNPVSGYRIVFRAEGGYAVHLSESSDESGAYTAALPVRGLFVPEAVIDPRGRRVMLDDDNPLQAIPGAARDVSLTAAAAVKSLPEPLFPGADRLFLSFAEDIPVVDHYRAEFQLDYGSYEAFDLTAGRLNGAIQIPGLPDVELGASLGYGNSDPDGGLPSESGMTDLDIWGKLRAGPRANGSDYGFGFVMTMPVGEEAAGLGADALGAKLFYAVRRPLDWAVLSYNFGLQFNEDGNVYGVKLDGEIAPSVGVALIFTPGNSYSVIAEFYASGERFEEGEADVRLLGGVNWKIGDYLHLRGALTLGLTDGAPSPGVTAGISFDY